MKFKVLNYGSINMDFVYSVDHIVSPGETIGSKNVQRFAGGKGANQSVAMARAGLDVWHAGKIGDDGKWLLDVLKQNGVHTEYIAVEGAQTGTAIIQVSEEADNAIVLNGGGNHRIEKDEVISILDNFNPQDFLVLQNEINLVPFIMEEAYRRKLRICFNPSPYDESIKDLPLEYLYLLIVNQIEAAELADCSGGAERCMDILTEKYPATDIVITAGVEGSFYGRNSKRIFAQSIKVNAVDTTAAGDTYFGYYLASVIQGLDISAAMAKAALASSITVTKKGAMDSIPFL